MEIVELAITVAEISRRTTIVSVRGELDMSGAGEFRAAVDSREEDGGGARRLIVDLTGATFIDSSGLGVIVGASKRAGSAGEVTVVAGDPRIRRVFQLTGLDRTIRVVRSLDEAVALPAASPAAA